MKKYFLLLSLFAVTLTSCLKNNSDVQPTDSTVVVDPVKQAAADSVLISAYLTANPTIKAKKDTASGLYYQILTPGTGTNPTVNSTVTVSYTGSLLNGTQFGSGTGFTTLLSGLIPAWQIGVPLIKTGGSILLIAPSRLGYGNTSPAASIPANSVLVFTINLTSFN